MAFFARKWAGVFLGLAVCLTPAWAAKISTSPVRVDLSGQKPTAILTVANQGDSKTIIQVQTVSWRQDGEHEEYEATEDVLAVPPLFELAPGKKQLVRIGMRKAPNAKGERAYRIYLGEVPDESAPAERTVRVLLRIGIPVFVHSPRSEAPRVEWNASCAKRQLRIDAVNAGDAHVKVLGFVLKNRANKKQLVQVEGTGYLLAGAKRSWEIGISECPGGGSILELLAQTDEGPLDAQIVLRK